MLCDGVERMTRGAAVWRSAWAGRFASLWWGPRRCWSFLIQSFIMAHQTMVPMPKITVTMSVETIMTAMREG